MKKSKSIFHNHFLWIILSLLFGAWVWTHSYYLSQVRLLVNKNWYAVKSEMISSNMMGATGSSFSRSIIAGDQINLRALYGANEINYQHDFHLSSLAFDFIVPTNAYLDVLFNIEKEEFSGIRLSKSFIYPSIYYRSTKSGKFLEVRKLDINLSNFGRSRGEIKEQAQGITLLINGKEIATLDDISFKWGQFGFKSGVRGAFVSKILARDVSGFPLDTRFKDLSNYPTYYMIHLLVIVILSLVIGGLVSLIKKKDLIKNVLKASSFIFFLGVLWFSFDYLYFSRIDTDWDTVRKSTAQFIPVNNDIEIPRFHLFEKWNEVLGGQKVDLHLFDEKFGLISGGAICYYCFNDQCGEKALNEKVALSKLPTIKIGLIGASFTSGSGALKPEDSFFAVSHKEIYKKIKDKYNVESFNLSINPFSYISDFEAIEKRLREEKFDFVILTKNTDFSVEKDQDEGFSRMVHLVFELNARPIFLSMQRNPEAMNRYNDTAILDLLNATFIYDKHKEEDAQKITDKLVQEDKMVILNPNVALGQLDLLRNGNIWWDKSHLTTYGYDIYGKWLAKEMITLISDKE